MFTCLRTALWMIPLLLATTGCLKATQKVAIHKDGSGWFEINYNASEQAIRQTKAMLRLREQMEKLTGDHDAAAWQDTYLFIDSTEEQMRKRLKRYEAQGITVDTLRVQTKSGWRSVYIKMNAKSIASAARADFYPDYGFTLAKNAQGNYVLTHVSRNTGEATGILNEDVLDTLSPILSGFHVTSSFQVPGTILESNAKQKTANTASWVFDYDADPNAILALERQNMKIVFSGKGLTLPAVRQ